MSLTFAKDGEVNLIKRVGGKDEIRMFLEKLGFIPGSLVTVITQNSGNLIVSIKGSRVAVNREMAAKIYI